MVLLNGEIKINGGVPGQTRYDVKTVDDLLNAGQKVSTTKK